MLERSLDVNTRANWRWIGLIGEKLEKAENTLSEKPNDPERCAFGSSLLLFIMNVIM